MKSTGTKHLLILRIGYQVVQPIQAPKSSFGREVKAEVDKFLSH